MVTQDGNSISLLDSDGNSFAGTVAGNTISWTGSFPEDGGTTTIESLTLTLTGDTLSGNSTWSWTDGSASCSGSSQISASRDSAVPEVEPNDEAADAQVITFSNGAAFSMGSVNFDASSSKIDESDTYALTLNSASAIEIELSHFDVPDDDLDLFLLDAELEIVAFSESVSSFEIVAAELSGGVIYYVVVRAFNTLGDAPYLLSIDLN